MKYYLAAVLLSLTSIKAQLVSFPGAEGDGKYTSGGRGGKVIEVTNLNDSGSGSFRDAVTQYGIRTVVFRVSGTIELESELIIENGDLTIAGQTAPGDGICIKNYQTQIKAENVIVRFLRFRLGDERHQEADALCVMNSKNVIVDHCSASWGIDEVVSFYDNENTTLQWCIISESLHKSYHKKGEHGYGGIWGGKNASFHHNLLVHNSSRNPRFNGSRTKYSPEEEKVDFRYNVVYNWGFNSSYGGENASYNIVNNYYKAGPATLENVKARIVEPWDDKGKWYIDGNYVDGYPVISNNNWYGGVQGKYSNQSLIKSETPFRHIDLPVETTEEAYLNILEYAGASLIRDSADLRIIHDVKYGSASCEGKKYKSEHNLIGTIITGIIDSQIEAGGWPILKSAEPPSDKDHDGMPDEWEIRMNLNPADPEDRNKIAESGYTYLEEYLNLLVNE